MATSPAIYADVLEHKHSQLDDDTVHDFLRNAVESRIPSTGKMFLDLSYNRLTEKGLKAVLRFMDSNPQVDVCVGQNYFNCQQFYRLMAELKFTPWVESGRICLGTTFFERKLDQLQALQESVAAEGRKRSRELTDLVQTSSNLANWGSNQREIFEDLALSILVKNLKDEGYTGFDTLPDKFCKIPYHVDEGQSFDAVEWDAVFVCEKDADEFLFLLEAKKTQRQRGMLNMPDRIGRTLSFIKFCNKTPAGFETRAEKARRALWSGYQGLPVRGVIAADVIPDEARNMAQQQKFITIEISHDGSVYKDHML